MMAFDASVDGCPIVLVGFCSKCRQISSIGEDGVAEEKVVELSMFSFLLREIVGLSGLASPQKERSTPVPG